MSLSSKTFAYLRDGIGNLIAAREIEGKLAGFGNKDFFVSSVNGSDTGSFDGRSWQQPFATIDFAVAQ